MSQELSANSDRVIVKPVESGEERFGSIIIPDMGKEKPEMGEVVSVGPGRQSEFGQFIRVEAKVGDIVLIPKIGIRFEPTSLAASKKVPSPPKLNKAAAFSNSEFSSKVVCAGI